MVAFHLVRVRFCFDSFGLEKFKWISNGVLTSSLSLYERMADLYYDSKFFVLCVCAGGFTERADCHVITCYGMEN